MKLLSMIEFTQQQFDLLAKDKITSDQYILRTWKYSKFLLSNFNNELLENSFNKALGLPFKNECWEVLTECNLILNSNATKMFL